MAERRVTISVDIDLARGSKEAYEPTIRRLADDVGAHVLDVFERNGFRVRAAKVNTLMHYVRHDMSTILRSPRKLKIIKSKSA